MRDLVAQNQGLIIQNRQLMLKLDGIERQVRCCTHHEHPEAIVASSALLVSAVQALPNSITQ